MNTTITCEADIEDPDQDSLVTTYSWSNLTTGAVIGTDPDLALDFTMGTGGDELECTVVATDPFGQSTLDLIRPIA